MTTVEEAKREVYWAGRQWCVTDYGLETITPDSYYIAASELGELTSGIASVTAERFRHVSEKGWVDVEDFAAAFAVALEVHKGKFPPLPENAFLTSTAQQNRSGIYTMSEMAKVDAEVGEMVEQHIAAGGQFRTIPDPHQPASEHA
jgi:hypothetical protein